MALINIKQLKTRTRLNLLAIIPVILCIATVIAVVSRSIETLAVKDLESKSKAILSKMETVRTYIAQQGMLDSTISSMVRQYPDGNLPDEVKRQIMKQVPISASWAVGETLGKEENYEFRIAAQHPFNPRNQADQQESELLKKYESLPKDSIITFSDEATNALWVVSPVYLKASEGCLKCHGAPSTSPWGNGRNILGMQLSNNQDGDLHGLFIIKSDLAPMQKQISRTVWWIIFIGSLVGLLVLLISLRFAQGIYNKLGGEPDEIERITQEISQGRLDVSFEQRRTKVGVYAELFKMNIKLSSVIRSIIEGADSLATASNYINSTSNLVSDGAAKQAEAAVEVGANMEEIYANIEQNADNAKATSSISKHADLGIKKAVDASKKNVTIIEEIAEKTKVISEFASQTNLLALNAGVEAARAGEYGRGFAVIAYEVRKLADKSKSESIEIEKLTKKALESSELTENELLTISPEIFRTSQLVDEIETACQEQKTGSNQVNLAVQSLASITQQNAASAEEMAASSEELASQAIAFKEIVAYFRLAEEHGNLQTEQKNPNPTVLANKPSKEVHFKPKTKLPQQGFNFKMDDQDKNYEQF